MSEGQAETTKVEPAAEPTPAPATAVAEKPNNEQATPAAVENKTTPEPQQPDKKELARTMFQKRQGEKEKKATERVAELEKQLAELTAKQPKETEAPKSVKPSLLDDPEGYEKWVTENATTKAKESILSEVKAYEEQVAFEQASVKAADFLLTRSHLKEDPSLVEEAKKILHSEYADIGAVNPYQAMRLAYVDLCAKKGIVPDMDGFKSGGFNATGGASSTSVRPSAPGAAKRTWAKREAEKYLLEAIKDKALYASRSAEISEARSEGRIK